MPDNKIILGKPSPLRATDRSFLSRFRYLRANVLNGESESSATSSKCSRSICTETRVSFFPNETFAFYL